MKLIAKVRIEEFRSIKDSGDLDTYTNFTTFAGSNNSGKSNLLKALDIFFNHDRPNKTVVFSRDFNRFDLKRKLQHKQIRITVSFNLPSHFHFQPTLRNVQDFLGVKDDSGRSFSITKAWTKNDSMPQYYFNGGETVLERDNRDKIDSFLALINFRYIPNRVLPIDVIKSEHHALRDALIRRLGREKRKNEAFDTIKEVSRKLLSPLSARLSDARFGLGEVKLSTPTTWADLIFAFGYKIANGDIDFEDELQGSGIQSLLMFETLYLIDKDYFQKIGWKQAAVWAVEEPESSLHYKLELQIANFLAHISTEKANRLQVFSTTHSDIVQRSSEKCFLVENSKGFSTYQTGERDEIIEKSCLSGVSRYLHPLLHYPLTPIIIPDGKYDWPFLIKAFDKIAPGHNWVVTYLEKICPEHSGGDRATLDYLKKNVDLIMHRTKKAPIVVLLDWDSASKQTEYEKLKKSSDDRLLYYVWPKDKSNPQLDDSFGGVEKFYSDRLITRADTIRPNLLATKKNGMRTISKKDYDIIKKTLFSEIETNGLQDGDLQYVREFLKQVSDDLGKL